jgi:hypothetical protein
MGVHATVHPWLRKQPIHGESVGGFNESKAQSVCAAPPPYRDVAHLPLVEVAMQFNLDNVVHLGRQRKTHCDRLGCTKSLGHIWRDTLVTKGDFCSMVCLNAARLEWTAKKAGEVS